MPENIHRGMLLSAEYSVNYDVDTGSGTFVTMPRVQLLGENSSLPREEAQRVDGINGTPLSGAVLNQFAFAAALSADDTWLTALRTAQDNLEPVWFRITELDKDPVLIGGLFGCSVIVEERVIPEFGNLEMVVISGATAGTTSGSTFESVGSGS